jgi:hypothetical protein
VKKDIEFPEYTKLHMAVTPGETDTDLWEVFLINTGDEILKNVLVSSSGYGLNELGEKLETGTLRHFHEVVLANQSLPIEKIDPSVFHLTNEYWISYWINGNLYDRRFLFVPDSLSFQNCIYVNVLEKEAVLHA